MEYTAEVLEKTIYEIWEKPENEESRKRLIINDLGETDFVLECQKNGEYKIWVFTDTLGESISKRNDHFHKIKDAFEVCAGWTGDNEGKFFPNN